MMPQKNEILNATLDLLKFCWPLNYYHLNFALQSHLSYSSFYHYENFSVLVLL